MVPTLIVTRPDRKLKETSVSPPGSGSALDWLSGGMFASTRAVEPAGRVTAFLGPFPQAREHLAVA